MSGISLAVTGSHSRVSLSCSDRDDLQGFGILVKFEIILKEGSEGVRGVFSWEGYFG